MKIGILITSALKPQRTGVEEYSYQIVRHMLMLPEAQEHVFFLYAATSQNSKLEILNPKQIQNSKSKIQNDNVHFITRPHSLFWTQRALPKLIRETTPDVFFSSGGTLPLRWRGLGVPAVVTVHGVEWERCPAGYSWPTRAYFRFATRHVLNNAQGIIVPSQHTKDGIAEFFGYSKNVGVIPHGVLPVQSNLGQPDYPRKRWNILFLGRKDKRKNIAGMYEAFGILARRGLSFQLFLVGPQGNDAYRQPFIKEEKARLRNPTGYISQEQKESYLRNADIFLFPSFDEGFGMPILEAQAHGVPVVCSEFLREIAGEGALYCDPANPQSIADALTQLMSDSDEELYRRTSAAALANASKFSWQKSAQQTLDFLLKEC